VYRVLVGKLERMMPLGRSKLRWEVILKWILRKWDVWHGVDRSGSG